MRQPSLSLKYLQVLLFQSLLRICEMGDFMLKQKSASVHREAKQHQFLILILITI